MSTTQAESWVRERRLRPIYELLDSGNNRKVIAEVDRLLKKQPQFVCAKVLKALALIRMSKTDEARLILEPVIADTPTDDGTIQALSICFRELDEPTKICTILESACKKEQSEELLTHCFMAQVRIVEYQKQHLTALNLYKLYNKPTYFGWAIASLHLKAISIAADAEANRLITLPLAERMLTKYIADHTTPIDETIMKSYVYNLHVQSKWEQVIEACQTHCKFPHQNWSNDEFNFYYSDSLLKTGKIEEYYVYLKTHFLKNLDEYDLLNQMVTKIGPLRPDLVDRFLEDICATYPSRVAALADLAFLNSCGNSFPNERMLKDFEMACRFGGSKPSFYSDIGQYLGLLNGRDWKDIFLKYLKPAETNESYASIKTVIQDVNYQLVERRLYPDSDPIMRMARAHRCLRKYFLSEDARLSLRSEDNLRTKESDFHDQFLIIAASCLLSPYDDDVLQFEDIVNKVRDSKAEWLSEKFCTRGQIQDNRVEGHDIGKDADEKLTASVNGLAHLSIEDKLELKGPYELYDEEYLMMTAIVLMEFGLERSPYNHSLRILLSQAYSRVGAIERACKVIQELDIKHVQWDSMGFLILSRVLYGGLYSEASKMFAVAENMYTSYRRESMEHIITAFKHGSFHKIVEFTTFREMLCASFQFGIVYTERRLLEYLTGTSTIESLLKVAENTEKEISMEEIVRREDFLTDNRDFTLIQHLAENLDLDELKKATFKFEGNLFSTRRSILLAVTYLVKCVNDRSESDGFGRFCLSLDKLYVALAGVPILNTSIEEKKYCGFWPSTIVRYHELNCLTSLVEQFTLVRDVIGTTKDHIQGLSQLSKIIRDDVNLYMRWLNENLRSANLLNIGSTIVDLHIILDTMSMSRIIFYVLLTLVKQKYEVPKAGKKKKSRNDSEWKQKYDEGYKSISEATKTLLDLIKRLKESVSKLGPFSWKNAESHWNGVIGVDFHRHIFPKCFDKVQQYICGSHNSQLDEMCKVASNLVDFWENFDLD